MMADIPERVTITCPASMTGQLKAAASWAIADTNWQDPAGALYAVSSYIPDETTDLSDIASLPVTTYHVDDAPALRSDCIQVIRGGTGIGVASGLHLSPVLPGGKV